MPSAGLYGQRCNSDPGETRHEADVGAQLFLRTSLTAAGAAFLPECRQLLRQSAIAVEVPRLAAVDVKARVTVGCVASALTSLLPDALALIRQRLPQIAVRVREIDTHEAVDGLRQGHIDIALARLPAQRTGVRSDVLVRDEYCLLVPTGHPLAQRERVVDLTELADESWVWPARDVSPDYHDDLSTLCRAAGFSPPSTHIARSIASQIALVHCGIGVTIIPATMATDLPPGVTAKATTGRTQVVTLAVTTRTNREPAEQLVHSAIRGAQTVAGDARQTQRCQTIWNHLTMKCRGVMIDAVRPVSQRSSI